MLDKILIGTLAALLLGAPGNASADKPADDRAARAASGALDGKAFKGKLKKKGDKKGDADVVTFQGGTVHSSACDAFGFHPSAYKSDGKTFEAECKSDSGAVMKWKGAFKGKSLKATASWSKEGEKPMSFSYEGTLQGG